MIVKNICLVTCKVMCYNTGELIHAGEKYMRHCADDV